MYIKKTMTAYCCEPLLYSLMFRYLLYKNNCVEVAYFTTEHKTCNLKLIGNAKPLYLEFASHFCRHHISCRSLA